MTKDWTHDLPVDKGAFEGGNLEGKKSRRTHIALGLMPEKLKSFWENRIFHSVMTKNWTHDLPVDKGAFEGGSLGGNRADEHFLLSVGCLKVWNFPRYTSFFPKRSGGLPLFPP